MKRINASKLWLIIPLVYSMSVPLKAQEFQEGVYYKISCYWQGDTNVLDVQMDAKTPLLTTSTEETPGQNWKFVALGNGYYRITNMLHGESYSLDIINDGQNNRLQLVSTGSYSGQFWNIAPIGNGYFRMTTAWLGEGKSLDILNDGEQNNQPQMADTGNYTGQFWIFATAGYD